MAPAMEAFAVYADDLAEAGRKGEAAVALRRAIDVTSDPAIVAYPRKRLPRANI
jgi:predicted RNA polymerase sigma factor